VNDLHGKVLSINRSVAFSWLHRRPLHDGPLMCLISLLSHPNMLSRTLLRVPRPALSRGLLVFARTYSNGGQQPFSFNLAQQEPQPGETLKKYSVDLTELAKEGKLDPVIGRDDEIRRTIQILSRRTKNNPTLVGPAGVGKTAIMVPIAIPCPKTRTFSYCTLRKEG
jgi:ATP-dependent Clp protease ATP-binding subunit ClpA